MSTAGYFSGARHFILLGNGLECRELSVQCMRKRWFVNCNINKDTYTTLLHRCCVQKRVFLILNFTLVDRPTFCIHKNAMIIQPSPSSVKYILHAQLYAAEMHFPLLNELMLSHFFFKQNKPILFVREKSSCAADGYSENFLHLWNAIFDIHHLQFFVIQPFSRYMMCVCLKISLVSIFDFSCFGLQIFLESFLRKDNMSNAS